MARHHRLAETSSGRHRPEMGPAAPWELQKVRRMAGVAPDIEDVSLSIADIEPDAKGVPVLLRQYLKAGGRLLGFNLDSEFSDVLDALIVADLRTASPALLERCMGASEARAFLAFHGRSEGSLRPC
jgi:hypothetical protein